VSRDLPHVDGVEHRFLELPGLRVHVAEAGEGEPLVMLHGWPQHWYEWRHLIPSLAKRYRVICPDLRGLGWTDAPPSGYEKEELASDVLALLELLGLDRVKLVGHDWGG
jgi:pimeloyl-ACP methyl ester carboxylesterase